MSDLEASRALVKTLQSELADALTEIEALRWLVEVQAWKPRGTYGRCMGADDWYKQKTWPNRQESYNCILAKALSDAGYGGGE